MQNNSPVFTVFTPTYNREKTLPRVYDSLCQQTVRNFEWLVIDDGSQDRTSLLIEKWIKESNFPIRYVQQKNAGKHVAFNKAVQLAHGELFLPADSDDAFVSDALEKLYVGWMSIPVDQKQQFSAVTVNCMDTKGQLIGTPFPRSPLDSDPEEMFFHYKIKGEKWGFHRTDVLKQFPFPEPQNCRFVSESYVWFRIARCYKTRFINENLRIYYQDAGNQLTKRTPQQTAQARLFYADTLNHSVKWFWHAPWIFYKIAALYVRFCLLAKDSPKKIFSQVRSLFLKGLLIAAFPLGLILATKDCLQSQEKVTPHA